MLLQQIKENSKLLYCLTLSVCTLGIINLQSRHYHNLIGQRQQTNHRQE